MRSRLQRPRPRKVGAPGGGSGGTRTFPLQHPAAARNLDTHAAFYRHEADSESSASALHPWSPCRTRQGRRARRGRRRIDHGRKCSNTGQLDQRGVVASGPASHPAEVPGDSSTGTIGSSLPCTMTVQDVRAGRGRSGPPPRTPPGPPPAPHRAVQRGHHHRGVRRAPGQGRRRAPGRRPRRPRRGRSPRHSAEMPTGRVSGGRIGGATETGRRPRCATPWQAGRARRRRRSATSENVPGPAAAGLSGPARNSTVATAYPRSARSAASGPTCARSHSLRQNPPWMKSTSGAPATAASRTSASWSGCSPYRRMKSAGRAGRLSTSRGSLVTGRR